MAEAEDPLSDEYDSPWKEVLEGYFPAFMQFFFPAAHADIDWSQPYEFLDKELIEVVRDAESGKRFADKLVKVCRRSGEEIWVLIHLEIQGWVDPEFPRRMYVYNYRLYDRYQRPVVSMALLADGNPSWCPDRFEYELWGSRAGLRFAVAKLSDYAERWEALEASDHPFAPVVMAHIRTQQTKGAPEDRMVWKVRIIRGLYERGYSRQDILELFRVIDWMMALPPHLDRQFRVSLQQYEEVTMRYVTSIERLAKAEGREEGREEGRVEGREEGLRGALLSAILVRFGRVPDEVREAVTAIQNSEVLLAQLEAAIRADSLEAFQQQLPTP